MYFNRFNCIHWNVFYQRNCEDAYKERGLVMPAVQREMTTDEAVKHLPGISVTTLRKWLREAYLMKAQVCPFGHAVLTDKGQWNYYLYPERLHAYITAQDLILRQEI